MHFPSSGQGAPPFLLGSDKSKKSARVGLAEARRVRRGRPPRTTAATVAAVNRSLLPLTIRGFLLCCGNQFYSCGDCGGRRVQLLLLLRGAASDGGFEAGGARNRYLSRKAKNR